MILWAIKWLVRAVFWFAVVFILLLMALILLLIINIGGLFCPCS